MQVGDVVHKNGVTWKTYKVAGVNTVNGNVYLEHLAGEKVELVTVLADQAAEWSVLNAR